MHLPGAAAPTIQSSPSHERGGHLIVPAAALGRQTPTTNVMRVADLPGTYEVRLHGDAPTAVVADLYHVVRNPHGGGTSTPVGHLSAAPRPAEPEAAAHWRVELLLRSDVAPGLIDRRLPEAIADWLLKEASCELPLLLNVSEGRSTRFVQRGDMRDDDRSPDGLRRVAHLERRIAWDC